MYYGAFENLNIYALLFMCALVRIYLKGAPIEKPPQKPSVAFLL
jgi:hypothetical protein